MAKKKKLSPGKSEGGRQKLSRRGGNALVVALASICEARAGWPAGSHADGNNIMRKVTPIKRISERCCTNAAIDPKKKKNITPFSELMKNMKI